MNCLGICIALGFISLASATSLEPHPLSDENIALINQKARTWKAGKNFEIEDWERVKRMASGVLPHHGSRKLATAKPHLKTEDIPESFDAREAWPQCPSLKIVQDQSACSSDWAVASAAAMSDRICIHSNQTKQTSISAEDLTTCCSICGYGCYGGDADMAWIYWHTFGIVSGGQYQANQGCKDYTLEPCQHHGTNGTRPDCTMMSHVTPECVKSCSDSSLDYNTSLTFGEKAYYFDGAEQIQLEILKNGPVVGTFQVREDFLTYKSGVYQTTTKVLAGFQVVRILGWGVEDDTPYWLIVNSWNSDWGDNGYIKFLRGENHLGIETWAVAALPVL